MMGRRAASQLYCFASERPRSRGIHVPGVYEIGVCSKSGDKKGSEALRTLVLSVSALHFFVLAFLYLSLKNTGSLRFVESCDFQYLGRVEPRVGAPAHDSDALAHPARNNG